MKHRLTSHIRRHRHHLLFAFRATAAALCAIAVAELFQLESPYWAALTALIVIQPTRGLIFEKSVYRLVGTGIGSLVGLLMLLTFTAPLTLTLMLGFWLGGCIAVSSLFHGLRSYGCIMAGITCAIITMSGHLRASDLYTMAFSRVACIIIGIGIATLITAFVTPKRSLREVTKRLDDLSSSILMWLAHLLCPITGDNREREEHQLLVDLVELESLLEIAIAGTFHSRRELTETTAMLSELMNLLGIGGLIRQQQITTAAQRPISSATRKLFALKLQQLVAAKDSAQARQYLNDLHTLGDRLQEEEPALKLSLEEILTSLHGILYQRQLLHQNRRMLKFQRHHDWREGVRGGLRALMMISCGGILWQVTAWHLAPLLIMSLAIMLTLFAGKEHPAQLLQHILIGALIGSGFAILCRLELLGAHSSATLESLIMVPFLFAGSYGMTQKRTAIAATDATFIFLLTLQPGLKTALPPFDMIFGACAMLLGISCAWVAYRFLIPINPTIRLQALLASINMDIRCLALERNIDVIANVEAQLRHKVMRIISLARYHQGSYDSFVNNGLIALAVVTSFQQLRQQFKEPHVPEHARHIMRQALTTMAHHHPCAAEISTFLQEIIAMEAPVEDPQQKIKDGQGITTSLQTAARLLTDNLAFWGGNISPER